MINQEQINEWKQKYGTVKKANISGKDYYFRPVTREEYTGKVAEMMQNGISDYELEVARLCLLGDPEEIENDLKQKAGLGTVLCEYILQVSGFQQVEIEDV